MGLWQMWLRTSSAGEVLTRTGPYHPQCHRQCLMPQPSTLSHLISKLVLSKPDQAGLILALLELSFVWDLDHRLHVLYSGTDGHDDSALGFPKFPDYLPGAKRA